MTQHQNPCMLITGASRRLGASLVAHWLHLGYDVIATYRYENSVVAALRHQGAQMIAVDVSTETGVAKLINEVNLRTSSLRAIVHNASVWHSDAEMMSSPELINTTFSLHLFSPFRINQALLPLLLEQTGLSDIIFISDASAHHGKTDKALYTASKSAMESLMRSQAIAFAPKVKVNALAPGLLAFHDSDEQAYRLSRLEQNLLGVEPGFSPAIRAIDYLINSSYTTGTRLVVDGGAELKRH